MTAQNIHPRPKFNGDFWPIGRAARLREFLHEVAAMFVVFAPSFMRKAALKHISVGVLISGSETHISRCVNKLPYTVTSSTSPAHQLDGRVCTKKKQKYYDFLLCTTQHHTHTRRLHRPRAILAVQKKHHHFTRNMKPSCNRYSTARKQQAKLIKTGNNGVQQPSYHSSLSYDTIIPSYVAL